MSERVTLDWARAPVTNLVAVTAIALELVSWLSPARRDACYNDLRLGIFWQIWNGELWRPATTTLLHGGPLHMAFNVYWLLVFGPLLERTVGSRRMFGLLLLLAYVSSLAEYVLANWSVPDVAEQSGLVGLSGVVYGLFGILLSGRTHDPEWAMACSDETVRVMLAWAGFCVVLSQIGVMPVANTAHFAGLIQGWLMGQSIFASRNRRMWRALSVAMSMLLLATLVAAPGHAGYELARSLR